MDVEAQLITLISIIVGLGLTEMFGNLHRLIRNRSRVSWDWLPVVWAATLLILVINYWWALAIGASGLAQANNAAEFGLLLIPPMLLFLTTASVLPNFGDAGEGDMRSHYDEQRKTFIVTFALYQCATGLLAIAVGTSGLNFVTVIRVVVLALLLAMLVLGRRRWDWAGVLAILAILLVRLMTQAIRS